jgi:hypothetical protein
MLLSIEALDASLAEQGLLNPRGRGSEPVNVVTENLRGFGAAHANHLQPEPGRAEGRARLMLLSMLSMR